MRLIVQGIAPSCLAMVICVFPALKGQTPFTYVFLISHTVWSYLLPEHAFSALGI